VNKAHLHPDWPRVVLLDLTAEQFKEFDKDPFAFTNKHDLYFEQPVVWSSPCAKPPLGKDIPLAREESRWTVAILHTHDSEIVCAACPQSTEKRKYK
jgi:hypothetical protein